MDVTRLRTLTQKSILNFGKHFDLSVSNLFALNQQSYLRWVYYNCSSISFVPEILDELGIKEVNRIVKPSVNKVKYNKVLNELKIGLSDMDRIKANSIRKKEIKRYDKMNNNRNKYKGSKSFLRDKNHGK